MAMGAAWKARRVLRNVENILAIELMCGAQGIDFRAPLRPGRGVRTAHERVRDIELSAGGETFKPEGDNSPYLLPGTTRRFRLSGNGTFPAAGAGIRLTAQSDGGKIDVLVHDAQRL